ncbi:pyridoxamine 5'-phosphate oxidase [Halostagnicola larsenii XH-48]|uniref:Pyridoxamine 5'-phosphate oxidase n=1 Tax=Halostagnicola larsenii XH-48 TaxID=797299 RepID=W0JK11_9EURY|nr:pyridoxamine 5'-phosphate oxidase family protein [Halostagnicola larsenii]AHF98938.1 pyridoxamine 5'-phosphate oxidase [Halostagnicola larsenii XH-48]
MVPDPSNHDANRTTSAGNGSERHGSSTGNDLERRVSRPETESSYGIPEDEAGTLPWSFVTDRLALDELFWVATTGPDGRPHARPVWGVWLDGTFHCGGGDGARWVRNLERNRSLAVHTEDAESVVIIEGKAEKLTAAETAQSRLQRIDDAYESKYGVRHGTPVFAVRPTTVLAWSDYPTDATRWRFSERPADENSAGNE